MKILLTLSLITIASAGFAQQDALYTQFWNNYSHINPAASGMFYKHQASALWRHQWEKVNGAPRTITANYNMKLDKIHGGFGVNYQFEKIGLALTHQASLNYSYHMKLGERYTLAAGVSAGLVNVGMHGDWIPPTNANDPSLPPTESGSAFDMNAGLILKSEKLTVGFSSTHLTESRIKNVYYSPARHYNLFADYTFNIGSGFYLKPQVVIRTDMVKLSADVNLLAYYQNTYWIGATYRTSDAIAFMAGWDIRQKFRIGYSYDITTNQLSSVSRGTHEVVIAFMLK